MSDSLAVIGLGRVGLPLALAFADRGLHVVGIDVDEQLMESLAAHRMPFWEVGADELLARHYGKNFLPGMDSAAVGGCEYVVLTLGTPVDSNMDPDFSQIDRALNSLRPHLHDGQTLILRSTVSPGTTQWVQARLEDDFGLNVGKDFHLAFCPERIAEGRSLEELSTIPQIVGGVDEASGERAAKLFSALGVECLPTDDLSAELAKLFTNMYRYINFAVANEFMILAGQWHRDINHVVNLVNHGYRRGGLALPGFTAGPCLFKDGFFLVNNVPFTDLITTAWKINESVPLYLVAGLKERMKLRNSKAVVMGAAFKANSDDPRQSLSFKVKKALERERANVVMHDPHIPGMDAPLGDLLHGADLVFVATNHSVYQPLSLVDLRAMVGETTMVCDIWNIFGTNRVIFDLDEAIPRPAGGEAPVSPV